MELNLFLLEFKNEEYNLFKLDYSEQQLKELRLKHNNTHSFFRDANDIYISNKSSEVNINLGSLSVKNVNTDLKITSSLIKHIFFRTFKDKFPEHTPIDFYPFRFFSKQEKDDIIYNELPDKLKNRIAYKKLIEVQLRQVLVEGRPKFGFVISIKRNWIFNMSCQNLFDENFNLVGLQVSKVAFLPGLENILAPDEEFIGIVKSVDKEFAAVETNEGLINILLSELSIKKTKYNIGAYLAHSLSAKRSEDILQKIEDQRYEIANAKKLNQEINNIAKVLFSNKEAPVLFENKDGFAFTVNHKMTNVGNYMILRTPTFIFDYAATKTDAINADSGLCNFGPYDSLNFEPKQPSVLCIGHKENRGYFSAFLANLKEGLPSSKYYKSGLVKKYCLHDMVFDIHNINSFEISEYNNIIRNVDQKKPDLAIIEIPHEFRTYSDKLNPYYKIKAKLLQLEIPVQFITTNIVKKHSDAILNSIALQIYAKLGGTPWVLNSNRSVDREIIVGIGHSWIRENTFKGANSDRVVGITTFLSSDGQYLLGDKA